MPKKNSRDKYQRLLDKGIEEQDLPGRIAHAVIWFRKYTELNPNKAVGWLKLGKALDDNRNYSLSMEAFSRSAKLLKGNVKSLVLMSLGRLKRDRGLFKHANTYFKMALKSTKNIQPWVHIYMGSNFLQWGEKNKGRNYFMNAYDISLTYPLGDKFNLCDESLLYLGYFYKSTGQYEKAKKAFQESLEYDPDYEKAKKELKTLELLNEALETANKVKDGFFREDELDEFYKSLHRRACDNWNERDL